MEMTGREIVNLIEKLEAEGMTLPSKNHQLFFQQEKISVYTIFPFFCSDFIREIFLTIISAFGTFTDFQFPLILRISVTCGTNFSRS